MKVIQLCDTMLLASEVEDLLVSDPKNERAFGETDPQDDKTVTDSDDLRRLMNARRVVSYVQNFCGTNSFSKSNLGAALVNFKNIGISGENAIRLIDNIVVTAASPRSEAAEVYIRCILGVGEVDFEKIREILVSLKESTAMDETTEHPRKKRATRRK